ncbi:two-component sensor histidine kinase [Sulfitobacter sp. SK012]|uniref:ATP-binding protein n=1 Tax=Sulfitobacter sp. SK012 TaxID=1389005 RepID=UPI000E0B1B04|nr:ATP-binding protein [Sulfitobacter sp. SK012]AXI46563.1 two-component sensor histidine kinase [Sulfitobacter sp. SK012]
MTQTTVLAQIIATLPLPTLVIDQTERIIAINASGQTLLATPALGRNFVTILRQPAIVEAVEACIADGTARTTNYLSQETKSETVYEVSVAKIANAQTVVLSFRDVTDVTQAGQMRRDFVANVSHELRTPLTALMGFIETLRGPARDDAAARDRFLGIMADEAERMNRLVGDLLSLSRVEAEERVRPTTSVDLLDVLGTTLRNLNPLATEAKVALRPDLGAVSLMMTADADQLQQVFTNLIENAIKYGGQGRSVWITATVSERDQALRSRGVRISIRDEGPGIDPVHLPRLTERFYRADSHRSRSLGGTGLGLAIVKHILNRHRGRLRITSELGNGAEFLVILPLE